MKMNMGSWDRAIRLVLAVAVAILLLTKVLHGALAVVLGIAALIFFLTAVFGFCPLYCPFRLTTREKTTGS